MVGTTKVSPKKIVLIYKPTTICEQHLFVPYKSCRYLLLLSHQSQMKNLCVSISALALKTIFPDCELFKEYTNNKVKAHIMYLKFFKVRIYNKYYLNNGIGYFTLFEKINTTLLSEIQQQ